MDYTFVNCPIHINFNIVFGLYKLNERLPHKLFRKLSQILDLIGVLLAWKANVLALNNSPILFMNIKLCFEIVL